MCQDSSIILYMARRSSKSIAEILSPPTNVSLLGENIIYLGIPDMKISLATEGSTIYKFVNSSLMIGVGYQKDILTASQSLAVNS